MTREYGNYEKYDQSKNSIEQETEKGENDYGVDKLMKNDREATMRMQTEEGDVLREKERRSVELILQNEQYSDQTIRERVENLKAAQDYPAELANREREMKMARGFEQ